MIRVAYNAVSASPGGGLTVMLGLLEGWRELGAPLDLTVYASRPPVMDAVREARPDIRIVPFAVGRRPYRHFIAQQWALGPLIHRQGADVVFCTNSLVGRCTVPAVVHHQNLDRFQAKTLWQSLRRGRRHLPRDLAAWRALKRARINTFISEFMRREAEKCVPSSAPRNRVVYNGLPSELHAAAKQPARWAGRPLLLALQAGGAHKGNDTLIRTLAELVRRAPETDWQLKVAGQLNFEPWRRLAAELKVADRVEYVGYLNQSQLDDAMREAVCLIYPSVMEGFGIPPLEAMCRSCPVVATDCTAIPEVVGDAAILVAPRDVGGFAEGVLRCQRDQEARAMLIERGRERISRFHWVDSARAMQQAMEDAATAGGG